MENTRMICALQLLLLGSAVLTDAANGDWIKPSFPGSTKSGVLDIPIGENQPVGQTSAFVEVEGATSYKILSQPIDGPFAIQNNGSINITKRLDYEKITSYVIVIEASYTGGVTTATVTINIDDKNDNVPTFPKKEYFVPVADNLTEGSFVTKVQATDVDRSFFQNYIADYSVTGGDADYFFMAGTSGEIYVAKDQVISRSVKVNYTFQVRATDNGTPARSGFSDVIVCAGCQQKSSSARIVPSIVSIVTLIAVGFGAFRH